MAVRILALLIPLAITLPQLQMTRQQARAPQDLAASVQPAAEPPWSYETRRVADAAVTRVVLESPVQEAVRTIDSAAAGVTPQVHKGSPRRTAPKLARAASPVKLASTAATPSGLATRQARHPPADAGCAPSAHCAPVLVAKVTPVARRPL